jgi:tetratricopeptide (TPR) repeat protein
LQQAIDYVKHAFELKSQNCCKQAIEMLYKALELESDNTEIIAQLGELYYLLNNHERAEHYLKKVLDKNPAHIESLQILRDIRIAEKDYDKALVLACSAYEQSSSVPNLSALIKILSKLDRLDEIKKLAAKRRDEAAYDYACALYEHAEYSKAQQILIAAPKTPEVLLLLGKIHFDDGKFDSARKVLEKLTPDTDKPELNAEILNYKGLFALEDMKFIEAITLFSKATTSDAQVPVYFYNLGNAYFYNGWLEEAAKTYLKAVCMTPENMDYRYSLAYLYYESAQFERAQSETDFILSNEQKHANATVLSALLKLRSKDFLGAKTQLEENISRGNNDDFTLTSLVQVYSELGLFDKAQNLMQQVIEKNPQNLNYKCDLAQIYVQEKDYEKALLTVDEVIESNENLIGAYLIGANAALGLELPDKAKSYAQSAISLDMNYAPGYYYLALVRELEKDYDEALECMQRAMTNDAANAKYYAKTAEIFQASGDIKTAMEYIKEAITIDENSAEYKSLYTKLASLNRKYTNL